MAESKSEPHFERSSSLLIPNLSISSMILLPSHTQLISYFNIEACHTLNFEFTLMMTNLYQKHIGSDIAACPNLETWSKQAEGELVSVCTEMRKAEYVSEQTPE